MGLLHSYFIEAFTRFMVVSKKVLELDDSACALANFAITKKGSVIKRWISDWSQTRRILAQQPPSLTPLSRNFMPVKRWSLLSFLFAL